MGWYCFTVHGSVVLRDSLFLQHCHALHRGENYQAFWRRPHSGIDTSAGSPSLALQCQHTPGIPSSIMSPTVTCISFDYGGYQLTCQRHKDTSSVLFCKTGAPDIILHVTYVHRMPFIALSSTAVQSAPCRTTSAVPIHQRTVTRSFVTQSG
jgi:hypothetical protein